MVVYKHLSDCIVNQQTPTGCYSWYQSPTLNLSHSSLEYWRKKKYNKYTDVAAPFWFQYHILFDSHCLQLRRAEKWVWYWIIKFDPFHPSARENHMFLESKDTDIKKKEKRKKMLIQCCQGGQWRDPWWYRWGFQSVIAYISVINQWYYGN